MTRSERSDGVRHDPGFDCWVVTDPILVRQALLDPRLSAETLDAATFAFLSPEIRQECARLLEILRRWFVTLDGDAHRSARQAVSPLFAGRRIRELDDAIGGAVDDALEGFVDVGRRDLVPHVADAVAARGIAGVLGLHGSSDGQLNRWARAMSDFLATPYRPERARAAQRALDETEAFLARAPAGALGALDALGTSGGEPLDHLATVSILLFGGMETTSGLVGLALWYLVENGLAGRVSGAPDNGEAAAVVERTLELFTPVGHVARLSTDATVIGDHRVPSGSLVLLSLHGGDVLAGQTCPTHPPTHAPLRRDHLAFGAGVHYCVGATLARSVATRTVAAFAARLPEATVREARWRDNATFRGLASLVIEYGDGRTSS